MAKLIIEGPSKLKGAVRVSGSKNAALPIICATLLVKGKIKLKNVPQITDVNNLLEILKGLGSNIKLENDILEIDNSHITDNDPDKVLVRRIRASILLAAPLLARRGQVRIATPGGCYIGNRPLDAHFKALEKLGVCIVEEKDTFLLKTEGLRGTEVQLTEMSVTATENAIMAAVGAKGDTVIKMAASEPHVRDLCHFLNNLGAKISGIGTSEILIKGGKKLKSGNYEIIGDEIEAGTYLAAAAATNSEIEVSGIDPATMTYSIFSKLEEANVNFKKLKNGIKIEKTAKIRPFKIWTAPAPHFPSDLQAPFGILATQAAGTTLIHETMYEGRLNYLKELRKMGADVSILDPHRAVIIGPARLEGKKITGLDLRAGATLLIAALIAEGTTEIENAEIIDRGYQDSVSKFSKLGGKIKRIN